MSSWTEEARRRLYALSSADTGSIDRRLHWFPNLGVGWYPVHDEEDYGPEYFDKYVSYETMPTGKGINEYRSKFVDLHHSGPVVDIGIGCGSFIKRHGLRRCSGYDVGSKSSEWLKGNGLWLDPYSCGSVSAITCWDSFEHIRDYRPLLAKVAGWAFMSMPIYIDEYHASKSKHFRPTEHWWYFTHEGLVGMMSSHGFSLVGYGRGEELCGREDIKTYAFRRV